jgi:hypothetical protein
MVMSHLEKDAYLQILYKEMGEGQEMLIFLILFSKTSNF